MKTLLAILLSFIVSEAPVLAEHGYTLGGSESVVGTYAGILLPISSTMLTTDTNSVNFGSNSLGLFTLNIPNLGVGDGSVVIYSGQDESSGSIYALPDPNNVGGIIGILTATSYATVFSGTNIFGSVQTEQETIAQASGSLEILTVNSSISNSPTGVNLTGSSTVTFSTAGNTFVDDTNLQADEQVTFEVEGFQQSTVAAATSATF